MEQWEDIIMGGDVYEAMYKKDVPRTGDGCAGDE